MGRLGIHACRYLIVYIIDKLHVGVYLVNAKVAVERTLLIQLLSACD